MVDIFLEYGYYIVGVLASVSAFVGVLLAYRKYTRDLKLERENMKIAQDKTLDTKISEGVQKVIQHIDTKHEIINQRFITSDTKHNQNEEEIHDIQKDIRVLEKDFKSLCQTIGKHEYIVDKLFPQYLNLRNSISDFKEKIDENLLSNNQPVSRNTENDTGEQGLK